MITEIERLEIYEKMDTFRDSWYALTISMLTEKSCKQSLLDMELVYQFEGDKSCYEPQRLSNRQRRTWRIDKDWIIEQRGKGLNNTQMARILGCSTSAITLAAQRFGIVTLKKNGEPRKVKEK